MRLRPRHVRGRSAHRSSHIPATDHPIRFGLHPSKREEKPAAFYLDSRRGAALKSSVFHSETEFPISARHFAPLSRGSDSTIFSCCAALKRYESPGQRSFIFYAQAEDLLHIALRQLGNGRNLVGNLLHIPLMFQLNQGLWRQRDASPKPLQRPCRRRLARRADSLAQNRFFERGHTLIPLRDELNQL